MIPLIFTEDANGRISNDGVRWPSFIDFLALTADVGRSVTVPSGAKHVLFNRTANVFVSYSETVLTSAVYHTNTVQTSSVCLGTAAELNPRGRTLLSVDMINVIAPDGASLTLSWFG